MTLNEFHWHLNVVISRCYFIWVMLLTVSLKSCQIIMCYLKLLFNQIVSNFVSPFSTDSALLWLTHWMSKYNHKNNISINNNLKQKQQTDERKCHWKNMHKWNRTRIYIKIKYKWLWLCAQNKIAYFIGLAPKSLSLSYCDSLWPHALMLLCTLEYYYRTVFHMHIVHISIWKCILYILYLYDGSSNGNNFIYIVSL